jgi:hypothetical protein
MLGIVESLPLAGVSLANLGLLDVARQVCQGQLIVRLLLVVLLLKLLQVKFLVILLKQKKVCLTFVTLLIRRDLTLCKCVTLGPML